MVIEDVTGRDPGGHVVAMLFGDDDPPAETAIAATAAATDAVASQATGAPLDLRGGLAASQAAPVGLPARPAWMDLAIIEAQTANPAAGCDYTAATGTRGNPAGHDGCVG